MLDRHNDDRQYISLKVFMMWLDVTMSVNISVTADMWTGLVARFMTLDGEFDKSFRHGAKMCDD